MKPTKQATTASTLQNNEGGFSLIEAMTTLSCALVLTAIAIPNFSNIIATTKTLNNTLTINASTYTTNASNALNTAR